jgi:hypothetical protein
MHGLQFVHRMQHANWSMFVLHAGYCEVNIASDVVKLLMSLIFLKKSKYDNPFESLFCKFIMKMAGTCFVAHHCFHESVILFFFSYMFGWIYHELLKVSNIFYAAVLSYFERGLISVFFLNKIGMGSVLVCLLPWLKNFRSRSTHDQQYARSLLCCCSTRSMKWVFVSNFRWCTDIK